MKTGVVRFYNVDKNYGFIKADDGSGETFVHISRIQKAGLEKLVGGQKISYKVKLDKVKNKNYASIMPLRFLLLLIVIK
jgi:cold shock protein